MLQNCKLHTNFDISIICIDPNCEQGFRFSCLKCLRQFHRTHKHLLLENILKFEQNQEEHDRQNDQCYLPKQKQQNKIQTTENPKLKQILDLKQSYLKQVEVISTLFQNITEEVSEKNGQVEYQIMRLIQRRHSQKEELQSEDSNYQVAKLIAIQNSNEYDENDFIIDKKMINFKTQLEKQIENMLTDIVQYNFNFSKEKDQQINNI